MEKRMPRRRFKKFIGSGAWQEKKLGEVLDSAIKGKAKADAGYGENLYLDVDFLNGGKREYINSPKNVKKEDVLILWDGSKAGTVYYGFEGALGSTLKAYKAKESGSFLFYYLKKQKKIIFTQFRTPNIPHVVKDFEKEFNIPIPSRAEQEKIGDFFQKLDRLIDVNRQKLGKLKGTKSAYLEEVFPGEGEDRPRRRFKGFTGEWEEKKLGEVADIISGGTPSTGKSEYWNGTIDWYSPTEIGKSIYVYGSKKQITKLGLEKSSAKILPADRTILFTSRAGIGDMAILKKMGTTNQGFQSLVLDNNTNVYFLYSMGNIIKKYALEIASGSTFLEISGKKLGEINISIPSLSEQEKIGNFFKKLDQQIEVQEEKLEKLEKMKKAYLAEMFV